MGKDSEAVRLAVQIATSVLITIVWTGIISLPVMLLWNSCIHQVFPVGKVSMYQAWGMLFMVYLFIPIKVKFAF